MNSKFTRAFCASMLLFSMCAGYNNCCNASGTPTQTAHPQTTYSKILDNMDELFASVFDEEGHLLTHDGMLIAQAHWATEIIDSFASRDLTRHWRDRQPADLSIIREIFEESLQETISEHPESQTYLTTPAIRQSMSRELGLA
jgi:hypothetical protein